MPQSKKNSKITKSSNSENLKDLIEKILDDNKATDITVLDIRGKSCICDFVIVASGSSTRQVASLADKIVDTVKPLVPAIHSEGKSQGDWVLVDSGDIIVHIFRPEVREFYSIEKIWSVIEKEKKIVRIGKK